MGTIISVVVYLVGYYPYNFFISSHNFVASITGNKIDFFSTEHSCYVVGDYLTEIIFPIYLFRFLSYIGVTLLLIGVILL